MIFFQVTMKMKNHQPQGVKNRKKFLKKINYILAKLRTMMRKKRIGNARNVKSFRMIRVVIYRSFAIFIVQSSTFSVQV